MRCTHCGSIIPPGLQQCPICGTSIDSRQAQEDFRFYRKYPKTNYQQGMPPYGREHGFTAGETSEQIKQYATPAFHTYRKQLMNAYPQDGESFYQGQSRDSYNPGGTFAKTLSDLPSVVKGAFTSPMNTLLTMINRDDRYTGGLLVFLSLIMSFMAAMIMVRGVLGSLFAITSGITGLQLAQSAASLNQGVSYLAGKVAVPVGGIAAVCQLIAAFIPLAVTMVYLCVMRQARCSFQMLSGFAAIITLPNLMALLLASVSSLITPYLSLLVLVFGQVFSYVLLCNMAVQLVNLQPSRVVLVQASLICFSELIKIILIAVVGGALMNGVIRTLTSLTNSIGGLL